MGQRHQAYMVARVVPHGGQEARYQGIGVLHDQFCSEKHALRAVQRLATLMKQPANSKIIREELRALDGKECHKDWERRNIPCPFTQFLFLSGWGTDLQDPLKPMIGEIFLEEWMNPISTDNNSGMTVIDITDPEKPAYCFISDIYDCDLVPKSAAEYLLPTVSPSADAEEIENLIRSFDAIPIISQDVIDDTWSLGKPFKFSKPKQEFQAPRPEMPSLVELTLKPAIERAIAENNTDVLSLVLLESTRRVVAMDVIRSQNHVSHGAFCLLQDLVSVQDKTLDLKGLHLSGEQIVDLLSLCGRDGSEIRSLDLSHNTSLRISDLEQVLQAAPKSLRRLVLLDTGVTDMEMVTLLDTKPRLSYHLESILHPAFLSGLYKKAPAEFSPQFTQMTIRHYYESSVSIPYFTPNTLAQGLTDILGPIYHSDRGIWYSSSLTDGLSPMAAYAALSRSSEKWGERTVAYIPSSEKSKAHAIHMRKGEWLFLIAADLQPTFRVPNPPANYAFIRANEKGQDFLSDSHGPETKTRDILFRPDLLDVFDIRGFFTALEMDGRPSPDPKTLEKLLNLFPVEGGTFIFGGYKLVMRLLPTMKE